MKKYIYIISLAAFFISFDIIYATKIEENKNKNAQKLNNYNPYHNLKESDFDNSNFSNEKQYDNENNSINNEKYIQPHSINNNSLLNKKDINNAKLTLYNKTNNIDDFRNFNHEHEKTNNNLTEIKKSFLQINIVSQVSHEVFNMIEVLYGVNDNDNVLWPFYKPIYSSKYIVKIFDKFNIHQTSSKKIKMKKDHDQVFNKIAITNGSCITERDELIKQMGNMHNPLYNFYNNPPMDDYNLYKSSKNKFVNCLKNNFESIKDELNNIISSEQKLYKMECTSNKKFHTITQKYSEFCKNTMNIGVTYKKKSEIPNDNDTIPFIDFLIEKLELKDYLKGIAIKLKFIKEQFKDIKNKYEKHIKIYEKEDASVKKCTEPTFIDNNCDNHFNNFKTRAESYGILDYNGSIIQNLEAIYYTYVESLDYFFKSIGEILIDKPDSNGNIIEKDGINDYDLSKPQSRLKVLEADFHTTFENTLDFYKNKRNRDNSNDINKNILLILPLMDQFTDLNKSMLKLKNDAASEKYVIITQIKQKLNQSTYDDKKTGFTSALKLAESWETKRLETIAKLNDKNEETVKLENEIRDLFKKYSDEVAEKKYIEELKLKLKETIKDIYKKKEYIKKAIDLKKEIENKNKYIDELGKKTPFQIEEYVKKKDTIYSTIKSELSEIYKGNIIELYNELSSVVQENTIDPIENKKELETLKSEIDNVYNKIQNMKIEEVELHLKNIETSKNELSNLILEIIKYIFGEIDNDLNKTLKEFKNKEQELSNKINDYTKENDQLSVYQSKIIEIRKHYNDQINVDNTKGEEAKQNYDQSKECAKKIPIKEGETSKFINEVTAMKNELLRKLKKYIDFDGAYKEKANSEHEKITELVKKIRIEISKYLVNNYEKKFNNIKKLIIETNKSIEEEYKNIDTLKKVDEYIKVCVHTNELISNFHNKQTILKDKLDKNINTVKETNSIDKLYTNQFENILTEKKTELDKTFTDAALNDHESNNNGLMEYFNKLKESLGKNKKNMLYQQFDEKEKAIDDIKKKNADINENVLKIEVAIYASIYNISDEMKREIGKSIESLNTQVIEKVKKNVTNLDEIKGKLKQYDFHDFGKEENIKYPDEINKIKNEIKTVSQQIDQHINKLEEIKKKSGSHIDEIKGKTDKFENVTDKTIYNKDPKEIEEKIKNIVTKIDEKKNIYIKINKLLDEISEIEKNNTSLKKVKDINVSYGQSLGKLFLEQIDEEKKKAGHMIKSMEEYMDDLDNIKKKSQEIENEMKINMDIKMYINKEMEALNISHDDDKQYHNISKKHEEKISDIHKNSLKIIQEFSTESNINDIKNDLQKNVSESKNYNNDINQILSKIASIYNILKLNKIKKIIDKVKEYTNEIEKNNKNITVELSNSKTIIKELEDDSNLKDCKSKIGSTIDDDYVGECIKKITDLKTYILNKETNIANHFKNAEKYNENVLLNFNNIEMADNKAQYILDIKKNNGTNNHDYNITELKKHKEMSNGYKNEADTNIQAFKKNKELFEKYKQDVTVLLDKYYAIALKNKFDKTKNDSEQIIKEIKDTHTTFISQADKSEQKMKEIKNEKINIEDEVAKNDKSNKAIIDIQLSVQPFETKFLKIKDLRTKSDDCLKETKDIEKEISNLSIDTQETKLKENGEKLDTLEKLIESLKNKKKNIEGKKKELDEVNSKIEKIKIDVNKHKKNYEIGIVEKINEIAKANKNQIESTQKLIKPTIEKLISSFKTNDLKGINTDENLGKYNTEMGVIYNEFMESYKLIADYLKTVSKEPITYDEIKNTRINAQNELSKNIKIENKAKSYLNDIEANEFDRIVTHFKNKLNTVNDNFKNEYSKVNEGFDNISNSINNVKNSTDENLLLNILNQTKQIYANIVNQKYYSYKYEAENIFINIPKLANTLNIQIKNSSGIDLFKNINIAILPHLDSQKEDTLTFSPSPHNISKTYTKISDSYNTLLDILKRSQELQKKEQKTLNLIFENRLLYDKVQATNELKDTLSNLKNKKEQILNEVKLLLHKSNELNKLSCNFQNYDAILEPAKYDKIKEKSNNYEQEKNKLGIDFDVTAMEKKFNNDIKVIEELENNYKSSEKTNYNFSEENNNILQSKQKLKELTNEFNTEIKRIEDKLIEKNGLINKLIEIRKNCMLFTHTTLSETLKIKITDYSEFIASATKFSKEFLKYIDDISNSLNDDIGTLQIKYDLHQTKKYVTSIFAEATNDNNDLIEKEKEATQAIKNLTNLFTIDSNSIDANALHNNKLQMVYFNSELHKSIKSIKKLYKKMHVFKLLNIGQINEKYFDISKQFDDILQLQESELKENLNDLKKIGQKISDKKNKFLNELSETPIPNFNTLKEIYHEIVKYESQIDEIKNITNDENDNITLYMDIITKLMKKVESILNFVTTYENDSNVIKQHIQDNNENDSQNMLKDLIQQNLKIIDDLKNKKQEIENSNNLQTINREQEITQTEHVNNTYHHDINETNDINQNHQYSNSDKKEYSKTRDTGNSVRYAGAIAFGLVTCYVIIRIKEKRDKDEMEFDKSKGFYDDGESALFEREDEVIEVYMDEDL
ncbi:hypothetical protein YYC_00032 [Plasmodium yoelii 17X]|uniref:Rh5 coiled-coil domain-containing protein n=1 Tax=Plasmodium yoelii 17X TaxID=1323249 RepID=V7PZA8_PLAYE|nr:hypothetical protein YYC_00032 [Plasmodium yoelii 17X]